MQDLMPDGYLPSSAIAMNDTGQLIGPAANTPFSGGSGAAYRIWARSAIAKALLDQRHGCAFSSSLRKLQAFAEPA